MLIQISSKRMCAYFEGGRLLHVVLNKLENGLVVSGKFTAFTKRSNGTKIKRREHKHMNIEIIGSDLTQQKLFSFTNSAVTHRKKA